MGAVLTDVEHGTRVSQTWLRFATYRLTRASQKSDRYQACVKLYNERRANGEPSVFSFLRLENYSEIPPPLASFPIRPRDSCPRAASKSRVHQQCAGTNCIFCCEGPQQQGWIWRAAISSRSLAEVHKDRNRDFGGGVTPPHADRRGTPPGEKKQALRRPSWR